MSFAGSVSLIGRHGSLVPLSHFHHANLVEAVKDGELWKLWYTSIPPPDQMLVEIDRRLGLQKQGSMLPFAVIENSSGEAVGMTTYLNIDAANRRVEIGAA
jgi:N-acetyltransferase